MPEIETAIAESDIFIFNGDTFDFRWSTFRDIEETVRESVAWLERVTEKWPACQFYLLLGNHDTVTPFMDAMDAFVPSVPNLEWYQYHLRLDDHLFLHGDVADRMMTASDLEAYRREWMQDEQRGERLNRIHDFAFGIGIHKLINRFWFPNARILKRVQFHLEDIGHGVESDIEHVIFGHTHVHVEQVAHGGQRFSNCGSPMPGIRFEILRTEVPKGSVVEGV